LFPSALGQSSINSCVHILLILITHYTLTIKMYPPTVFVCTTKWCICHTGTTVIELTNIVSIIMWRETFVFNLRYDNLALRLAYELEAEVRVCTIDLLLILKQVWYITILAVWLGVPMWLCVVM